MHARKMHAAGHSHDSFPAAAGCAWFSSSHGCCWLPLLRGAAKLRLAAAETCGSGWKYAAMPLACPGSALPGPGQPNAHQRSSIQNSSLLGSHC